MAQVINEKTVNVHQVDAEGNDLEGGIKTEMTSVQWNLIGSDMKTNGGWALDAPKETNATGDNPEDETELKAARVQYEEVTGQKAGKRNLETLREEIARKLNA